MKDNGKSSVMLIDVFIELSKTGYSKISTTASDLIIVVTRGPFALADIVAKKDCTYTAIGFGTILQLNALH